MDLDRSEVDALNLPVSTGGSDLGKVKNKTLSWAELCERLGRPTVDQDHTLAEYLRLSRKEQDRLKNTGFFVGGHCEGGERKSAAITERSVICLDIDAAEPDQIESLKMGLSALCEFEFFAHTTRKHDAEKPRWRVVLPLKKPIVAEQFAPLARILASKVFLTVQQSMDAVDDVSFRLAQVMYWPSHCREADFETIHNRGALVDGAAVLKAFGNWRDWTRLPYSDLRSRKKPTDPGKKAEDPRTKKGIIGAFCRAYDVESAIATFIPEIYTPGDEGGSKPRYSYAYGSTSNGAIVEDDGLFLYSHHGTDPCGERLVNAFDMVRLHLFHEQDEGEAEDAKPTTLPSFKAMEDLLADDRAVIHELQAEHYDVTAMFDDCGPAEEPDAEVEDLLGGDSEVDDLLGDSYDAMIDDSEDGEKRAGWMRDLDLTEKGTIKPTLTNIALIMQNDPRLEGVVQMNAFTQEIVTRKAMRTKMALITPIPVRDTVNGDLWTDRHDHNVRALLEAPHGKNRPGYGLRVTDRDLTGAVNLAAAKRAFHPVRDYLNGLTWDGTERLETLFIRYLGAPDTPYSRSIARNTLLGAVVRAMEPGHKFDFVLILEGLQGKRKTTFIQTLARNWFAELEGDFADRKMMVEQMQGAWVLEIPELSGFNKVEAQALKAFVSAVSDKTRLSYGRRAQVFLRQCIFIGSTNDEAYLRDATGGRRFWPIHCDADEIDTDAFAAEVDQVWAEAAALYRAMREKQPRGTLPLFLADPNARKEAEAIQESRRVETPADAIAGRIAMWLERPMADESGFEEVDVGPQRRDETCLQEIWVECLGGDIRHYSQAQAQLLGQAMRQVPGWKMAKRELTEKYGRQRLYWREGTYGRNKLLG